MTGVNKAMKLKNNHRSKFPTSSWKEEAWKKEKNGASTGFEYYGGPEGSHMQIKNVTANWKFNLQIKNVAAN